MNKSKPLLIRLTPDEHALWVEQAKQARCSVAALVRKQMALLKQPAQPVVSKPLNAQLI